MDVGQQKNAFPDDCSAYAHLESSVFSSQEKAKLENIASLASLAYSSVVYQQDNIRVYPYSIVCNGRTLNFNIAIKNESTDDVVVKFSEARLLEKAIDSGILMEKIGNFQEQVIGVDNVEYSAWEIFNGDMTKEPVIPAGESRIIGLHVLLTRRLRLQRTDAIRFRIVIQNDRERVIPFLVAKKMTTDQRE